MTSRPVAGTLPPLQRPPSVGVQRPQDRRRPRGQSGTFDFPRLSGSVVDLVADTGTSDAAPPNDATQSRGTVSIPDGKANATPEGAGDRQGTIGHTVSGKPPMFFDDEPTQLATQETVRSTSTGNTAPNPMSAGQTIALPPRPGAHAGRGASTPGRTIRTENKGARRDGQKTPAFEPPLTANRYLRGKEADFFPWSGNHPEDVLNEQVVRSGYVDGQNKEFTSARASIGPHLKNKAHLQTLSSLFVSVLEKRQTLGRLTAPSTFKPLPRVTLKDTKREEWLRDLANPAVALRKLARTIPHGIRGKILLEQFLSKNIPTARAVWLAKCVGANEIRAFKRKGASGGSGPSGEVKWVREWTIFVEQFVDSAVGACGQPDWKSKMEYTIRLSAHLYSEHLLDQDHYLDWLLSSFESSSLERLPVWLLQLKIYWKDLVISRRRGRRIAEAFLGHTAGATPDDDGQASHPVLHKLQQGLLTLVCHHPSCLVLPTAWEKHKRTIQGLSGIDDTPRLKSAVDEICRRNERLATAGQKPVTRSRSRKTYVIATLDSVQETVRIDSLSSQCLELLPDRNELIAVVLEWASTVYRVGHHRLYLAIRLLRKWSAMGIDINGAIQSFVMLADRRHGIDQHQIFRIVAELVRSRHFSVGRYLQWLIAAGALVGAENVADSIPCHLRLVTEIPSDTLPPHISNLRSTILRDIGFDPDAEGQQSEAIKSFVAQSLPEVVDLMSDAAPCDSATLSTSNLSVKLDISRWIRQQVNCHTTRLDLTSETGKGDFVTDEETSAITPQQFHSVRDILETIEDFPILADVLGIASTSPDPAILASVADTINYHLHTFAAIGALQPLSKGVLQRHESLRAERPIDREFCLALTDLFCRISADSQTVQRLKRDLTRCEPRASVPVCSPVSDNMADSLQNPKADFDDEIERLLYSGSSMDEQTLVRVFRKIVLRMEEDPLSIPCRTPVIRTWFHRLRHFDESAFDRITCDWIRTLLLCRNARVLPHALVVLVNAGCLSLAAFMDRAERCLNEDEEKDHPSSCMLAAVVLDSVLPAETLATQEQLQEYYRFRLEQRKFCFKFQAQVAGLAFRLARLHAADSVALSCSEAAELLDSDRLLEVIRRAVGNDSSGLWDMLAASSTPSGDAPPLHKQILDRVFDPSASLDLSEKEITEQIRVFVQTADELSLPFCKLQLRQALRSRQGSEQDPDNAIGLALFQAIESALIADSWAWVELVGELEPAIAAKIRERAEVEILSAYACDSNGSNDVSTQSMFHDALKSYLAVVDSTASSIPKDGLQDVVSALVDRLSMAADMLSTADDRLQIPGDPIQSVRPRVQVGDGLNQWLSALLHLCLVHKQCFHTSTSHSSQQVHMFALLLRLVVHPKLQDFPAVAQYVFDVVTSLADDLSEDVRSGIARQELLGFSNDARISFIFGSIAHPDNWLGVSTAQPVSSNVNTRGSGQTRAAGQHSINRQQFQQQQTQKDTQTGPPSPMAARLLANTPQQQQSGQRNTYQEATPLHTPLRRWEILPDPTSNAAGNDTALSLGLFGARKV